MLTVTNLFVHDSECHIKVKVFTLRQEIRGLELKGGDNLNLPKVQVTQDPG